MGGGGDLNPEAEGAWDGGTWRALASWRGIDTLTRTVHPSAEGNGNPLQYSRLENFMDRGA